MSALDLWKSVSKVIGNHVINSVESQMWYLKINETWLNSLLALIGWLNYTASSPRSGFVFSNLEYNSFETLTFTVYQELALWLETWKTRFN